MSLDIDLYKDGQNIADMNWLRNPYGLERWAEANTDLGKELKVSLYNVCNIWAYNKASDIDRKLFKEVVDKYWAVIKDLKRGYFFFNLSAYRQFVEPHVHLMPKDKSMMRFSFNAEILDAEYIGDMIKIPVEHFAHPDFNLGHCSLEDYKSWFKALVEFAELLQDEETTFECTN